MNKYVNIPLGMRMNNAGIHNVRWSIVYYVGLWLHIEVGLCLFHRLVIYQCIDTILRNYKYDSSPETVVT